MHTDTQTNTQRRALAMSPAHPPLVVSHCNNMKPAPHRWLRQVDVPCLLALLSLSLSPLTPSLVGCKSLSLPGRERRAQIELLSLRRSPTYPQCRGRLTGGPTFVCAQSVMECLSNALTHSHTRTHTHKHIDIHRRTHKYAYTNMYGAPICMHIRHTHAYIT